ncbi:MAG: hypothetical protein COW02_03915 [Comamonadaceae bacterium CG12_big_fil_rev_8_21_14_0_65_59_15]|nr:MAG: hypothetical protein COW02_03915 [Comamonadaceae bacterium CG12_big_fil_rev_8_21_14_0_65_59_15]
MLGGVAGVVSPANTRESTNGYLTLETSQQACQFVANKGVGGDPAKKLLLKSNGTLLAPRAQMMQELVQGDHAHQGAETIVLW